MLVERYISDGTPIASKTLAGQPGMDVSPATVRNIMADLEARGLVVSPHTSAGKIPTHFGLRFFVDSLLSVKPIDFESLHALEAELNPDLSPQELVEAASNLLAGITQMAGVVTVPRPRETLLRHTEFLPLSDNRVLVILVVNEREVQNRVIHTDREYTETELLQAANFINQEFVGETMLDVRTALLDSMQADKDQMDALMQAALDLASKAFEVAADVDHDYVVHGESNLIVGDPEMVRQLFDAFSKKRDILHLLDRCLESDGIQLFIGDECGYEVLGEFSVVSAPYQVKGQVAGVLGVIGPTRMAYQQVIPVVDVTARVLGAALDYS
jgi:heat-inducible transcriptional repressor